MTEEALRPRRPRTGRATMPRRETGGYKGMGNGAAVHRSVAWC